MRFLTRDAARAVDEVAIRDYHLPGLVLMENAGRGTADWLRELGVTSPVVICCGKGNNGGDGFVVARHLELHGLEVEVVVCCDPVLLSGDARVNYDVLVAAEMPMWILGVDGTVALEAMKGSMAYSRAMDAKGAKMLGREYTPQARLSQHLKDLRLILQSARGKGLDLPLGSLHAHLLEQAETEGLGDFDNSAVFELLRRRLPANPAS